MRIWWRPTRPLVFHAMRMKISIWGSFQREARVHPLVNHADSNFRESLDIFAVRRVSVASNFAQLVEYALKITSCVTSLPWNICKEMLYTVPTSLNVTAARNRNKSKRKESCIARLVPFRYVWIVLSEHRLFGTIWTLNNDQIYLWITKYLTYGVYVG